VVDACSVAICMPVEQERRICGPGGVSWALDVVPDVELALGKVVRKCTLINDFVAVGLGIHALEPSQVQLLTPNVAAVPRATALCLGPGTGLGTCFLTYNESVAGYDAHPGEGGAPEFAARTAEEWAFKQFLESEGGRGGPAGGADGDLVIVENMVSGPGLGNCFRFLSARQPPHWGPRDDIRPSALDGLGNDELPAAVASRATGTAPAGEDSWVAETCAAAMELWLGSFVRELRAASLRFLPTGGLYLAGGVCTKLMPRLGEVRTVIFIVVHCTAVCVCRLEDATCLFECCVTQYVAAEFAAEAVNADILRTIPVSLIDDSADVGLLGARVRARRMLAAGASEAASAL
jgi:glucokinase